MKQFWKDFKAFISKGNIIDLAVAVIIGAAFGKIVTSLVNDIVMPLISLAVGGASVADWKWVITPAQYDVNGVVIVAETALRYGVFLQAIFDFLIIAFFIFVAIKVVTSSQKRINKLSGELKTLVKKKKGKNDETTEIQMAESQPAEPAPVVETTDDILKEIRDLLKLQNNNANLIDAEKDGDISNKDKE